MVYILLLVWIKINCYILIGIYSIDIKEDMGYNNKYKVFEMGIF